MNCHAQELNGSFIGKKIVWPRSDGNRVSEEITMITHKKNGNVLVRHGRGNRQWEFRTDDVLGYGDEVLEYEARFNRR
jgi:hypothetical protein